MRRCPVVSPPVAPCAAVGLQSTSPFRKYWKRITRCRRICLPLPPTSSGACWCWSPRNASVSPFDVTAYCLPACLPAYPPDFLPPRSCPPPNPPPPPPTHTHTLTTPPPHTHQSPPACFGTGSADLSELRAHPFFEGVDWAAPRSAEPPEFLLDPMDAGTLRGTEGGCEGGAARVNSGGTTSSGRRSTLRRAVRACSLVHTLPTPLFLLPSAALSSADSSFDWELQSLASALPRTHDGDELGLE